MTLFEDAPVLTNHKFKIKGGKYWHLTQEYYDELKSTFPLHDVEGEMREAKLWCTNVSARKRKTAKGMARFLSGWVSRSEATGHVTVEHEKSSSEIIKEKNIASAIDSYKHIIMERTVKQLKADTVFMGNSRMYPEFRDWAVELRPDLLGGKPPENLPNPKLDKIKSMVQDVKTAKENGVIDQLVKKLDQFAI